MNCAFTPREAIDMTQRLSGMNIRWIEEPTWPPEDFAALAEVNKHGELPVAAGENITTATEFSSMFRQGAVAFAQPSVAKIGVSSVREVAASAATHDVKLAPHSPYFGPGLIATMHIAAAAGGDVAVERYFCDLEPGPLGDAINVVGDSFVLPNAPDSGSRSTKPCSRATAWGETSRSAAGQARAELAGSPDKTGRKQAGAFGSATVARPE